MKIFLYKIAGAMLSKILQFLGIIYMRKLDMIVFDEVESTNQKQ